MTTAAPAIHQSVLEDMPDVWATGLETWGRSAAGGGGGTLDGPATGGGIEVSLAAIASVSS